MSNQDENLLQLLVRLDDDPFALRPEKARSPQIQKPRSKLWAGFLLASILAGHLTLLGISLIWSGTVTMPRLWTQMIPPDSPKEAPSPIPGELNK